MNSIDHVSSLLFYTNWATELDRASKQLRTVLDSQRELLDTACSTPASAEAVHALSLATSCNQTALANLFSDEFYSPFQSARAAQLASLRQIPQSLAYLDLAEPPVPLHLSKQKKTLFEAHSTAAKGLSHSSRTFKVLYAAYSIKGSNNSPSCLPKAMASTLKSLLVSSLRFGEIIHYAPEKSFFSQIVKVSIGNHSYAMKLGSRTNGLIDSTSLTPQAEQDKTNTWLLEVRHTLWFSCAAPHPHLIATQGLIALSNPDPASDSTGLLLPLYKKDFLHYMEEELPPPDRIPLYNRVNALAQALSHMHKHGIAHRDIKPANLMDTETGSACLFDLGFSIDVGRHVPPYPSNPLTPGYAAPEACQKVGGARLIDPIQADAFSFGITVYELAMNREFLPYEEWVKWIKNPTNIESFVQQVFKTKNTSSRFTKIDQNNLFRHLVLDALRLDPKNRSTVTQLAKRIEANRACYEEWPSPKK